MKKDMCVYHKGEENAHCSKCLVDAVKEAKRNTAIEIIAIAKGSVSWSMFVRDVKKKYEVK